MRTAKKKVFPFFLNDDSSLTSEFCKSLLTNFMVIFVYRYGVARLKENWLIQLTLSKIEPVFKRTDKNK